MDASGDPTRNKLSARPAGGAAALEGEIVLHLGGVDLDGLLRDGQHRDDEGDSDEEEQ